MRKSILWLMALCLCLSLAACGGGESAEEAPEEKAQALVEDVFACDTQCPADSVGDGSYHIPRLTMDTPEAQAVNEKIYNELYPIAEESIAVIESSGDFYGGNHGIPAPSAEIGYSWSVTGDVLSLRIYNNAYPGMTPQVLSYPYAIDVASGAEIPGSELRERFGITDEDIAVAIGHDFLNGVQDGIRENYRNDVQWCFDESTNMANQTNMEFYLGDNGELCCTYSSYWFAGATRVTGRCQLTNYELNPYYAEFAGA